MTGGVDEDYGTPGSSRLPTEGPEDERAAEIDHDGAAEASQDAAPSGDLEFAPRPSRPFRGWGAAHERDTGPSLWERFVAWLSGLFARRKSEPAVIAEEPELDEYSIRQKDEYAILIPKAAPPEPVRVEAVVEYVEEVVELTPAAEAEPEWDTPVVAEPSARTAPPTLQADDFSDVWSQRKSPLEGIDPKIFEEPVEKPGFFARLFSRKKKSEPEFPEDEALHELQAREPADADFASDAVASAAPAADDFADAVATDSVSEAPSLDHSARDAASLAAFLASAPAAKPPAEDALDPSLTADSVPDAEFTPLSPLPADTSPKKLGFFSGLLRRVSRSEFIPPQAVEAEAPASPPVTETAEVVPIDEPHIVEPPEPEPAEGLAAKYGPPAVKEDFGETVPVPIPAVPRPTPPPPETPEVFETTQSFTAFRDARDDFAEDEAKNNASATDKVEAPADLDEKTDEFEVVPPPTTSGALTAETRVVPGFFGRMFGRKQEEEAARAQAHTGAMPDDTVPFVLAKFRSFYNEVVRDKHQKSDVIAGFATAVMGAGGASESDPEFAAQLLSKRLSEMLELQAAESNWTGGDAAKYYPEAQYAMVALADETFATIDWPGRASWHKYMLEPKMYGTRGADIEFFKRIDKLLKEAPDDKGARDLARLYLMVIASGYRGKFRIPNVRRPLAEYRRRLYEYSHQADPLELYAKDRKVFPQAVAHTLVSRSVGRFTPAQRWIAVVLILAILYIGVSHYMWTSVSADVRDVVSRIQSSISQSGPR